MSAYLPKPAAEDQYGFTPRRIDSVTRVELIQVVTAEGNGTTEDNDYVRMVARFYTLEGQLVAVGAAVES